MLYKVTGVGQCVCVCVWVWSQRVEFNGAWGKKRGEGGVELPDSLIIMLFFSLLVLAWRLHSLLPDGNRLNKLCDGWVGSPAMQRALQVRRVL